MEQIKYHSELETIYVYIAACKENYVIETVESILLNAKHPGRVHVGVFNNILDDSDKITDPFILRNSSVTYTEFMSKHPMGTGFSRMNASLLAPVKTFDYMLQIDAHSIFDNNWDEELVTRFKKVEAEHGKVVLSTMCSWWMPSENDDKKFLLYGHEDKVLDHKDFNSDDHHMYNNTIEAVGFAGRDIEELVLSEAFSNINGGFMVEDPPSHKVSRFIYAGYLFARFDLIREVLHDPYDVWSGDQFNYTIRLISRGYKIFTTAKPLILTMNKVRADGSASSDRDWRPFQQAMGIYGDAARYYEIQSQIDLYKGKYLGYWGAPDLESLDKAKRYIDGIDD